MALFPAVTGRKTVPAGRTVLLIHGAWHGAWCWERVVKLLNDDDIITGCPDLPLTSFDDDVACVQEAVLGANTDVVACGHSYGGRLVSAATSGLPQVSHLVYLSSVMPNDDQLIKYAEQRAGPRNTSRPDLAEYRSKYCNACSEEDIQLGFAHLRDMTAIPGGIRGLDSRPWLTRTSTYIVCTLDKAIEPGFQHEMAANATHQTEILADHSAFFSAPEELARTLTEIVRYDRPSTTGR
jgi:pimeloyl-ACP methyl ester carboxylesterase